MTNEDDVDNNDNDDDSDASDDGGNDSINRNMNVRPYFRKDVVCAIISCREGNPDFFLIGRRAGTSVMDGYYEFPGGKVSLKINTT